MKLDRRVVAMGAVAALTLATPSAALAAGKSAPSKSKVSNAQAAKAKAAAAAKREAARKKAEEARAKFTFPGTVVSVSATGLTITRKERGVVVQRTFVLDSTAVVKRDGVRVALADVKPGDHAMAQGRKVNGVLTVFKLNVSSPVPAPVVPDTATATILI